MKSFFNKFSLIFSIILIVSFAQSLSATPPIAVASQEIVSAPSADETVAPAPIMRDRNIFDRKWHVFAQEEDQSIWDFQDEINENAHKYPDGIVIKFKHLFMKDFPEGEGAYVGPSDGWRFIIAERDASLVYIESIESKYYYSIIKDFCNSIDEKIRKQTKGLNLAHQKLSGKYIGCICKFFPNIEALDLSDNPTILVGGFVHTMGGKKCSLSEDSYLSEKRHLAKLETLNFDYNYIDSCSFLLRYFLNLKKLYIRIPPRTLNAILSCQLRKCDRETIKTHSAIECIDLSGNIISGGTLEAIMVLPKLRYLFLNNILLSSNVYKDMIEELFSIPELTIVTDQNLVGDSRPEKKVF